MLVCKIINSEQECSRTKEESNITLQKFEKKINYYLSNGYSIQNIVATGDQYYSFYTAFLVKEIDE